ncbi:21151_t:CDS:2, partial [Racocetra persica]
GSYKDFINLRFDIEFNSDVTLEQIAYIVGEHNSIEEKNGIRYKEDKIDYVIEDLDDNKKYDSDASISSLSSNDSETTKRRKKGKT